MTRLLFLISLCPLLTLGNVKLPADFYLSELKFSGENYTLEFCYSIHENFTNKLDSLCVKTKESEKWFRNIMLSDQLGLLLFTRDSFPGDFKFNFQGDVLEVCAYFSSSADGSSSFFKKSTLGFGTAEPNTINLPDTSYSIAYFDALYNFEDEQIGVYSLDRSPTIGSMNDTIGTMGKLSGIIYDSKGNVAANEHFQLLFNIDTDEKGYFQIPVHGNTSSFTKIYKQNHSFSISPLTYSLIPGDQKSIEIHITDPSYIAGTSNKIVSSGIRLYPNPAFDYLNIEFCETLKEKQLIIYDTKGSELISYEVEAGLAEYRLTLNLPDGMYSVLIKEEQNVIFSQKLLIHKSF